MTNKDDPNGERFAVELDRFRSAAVRIATRELRNPEDAEDCVQDATIRAWQKRDAFDPAEGSLKGWFLAIVNRACLDYRRRAVAQKRRAEFSVPDTEPVEEQQASGWIEREDYTYIDGEMEQDLTLRQHEAVGLSSKGFTTREIAARMGVSHKTAARHLKKARIKIRDRRHGQHDDS